MIREPGSCPSPPPEDFWLALLWSQLFHPLKVLLIEVLTVIDRPLSANHVYNISEKEIPLSSAYYHLASLEKLGVLEKVDSRRARGATERLFFWVEGTR